MFVNLQCFNLSAPARIAGSQILHHLVFFLAGKPKDKEKRENISIINPCMVSTQTSSGGGHGIWQGPETALARTQSVLFLYLARFVQLSLECVG